MIAEKIESLQHKLVKHLCKLKKNRNYRYENQEILLIGSSSLKEVKYKPKILFIPEDDDRDLSAEKIIQVNDLICHKVTGLKTPTPFAIFSFPQKEQLITKKKLLVLDEIKDPGNLGTIFRTAYALSFEGIYLTTNTVDPFNDKALSASKGSCLNLPFLQLSKTELEKIIVNHKFHVYLADTKGKESKEANYKDPLMLILSHEAKGPKNWSADYTKVKIPMQKGIDSLNVAIAGAVLMYEIQSQKS